MYKYQPDPYADPTLLAAPIYLVGLSIYRLLFHRCAHIPGPKLAALTYYYQSYFDLWPQQGQFLFHCKELHEKYGPVVRIGPDEIHVDDPDFYNEIYTTDARRRRDKSTLWFWMVGSGSFLDQSAFATLEHNHHRLRRSALNPHFSKAKVQALESGVRNKVLKLKARLLQSGSEGEVVNLLDATSSLTLDVISEYSFGRAFNALDSPDYARPWNLMLHDGVRLHPFGRTFPTLARVLLGLMQRFTRHLSAFSPQERFVELLDGAVESTMKEAERTDKTFDPTKQDPEDNKSVLLSVLRSPLLPPEEKTQVRLLAEAMNLIGAGTETTGRTLGVALYHILAIRQVHDRLLAEIRTVMPASSSPLPAVSTLERLPYLTAVVRESLRTAHGTAGRLVRIAPDEDLLHNQIQIPKGATFSQSQYLYHMHPKYFPDPSSFVPDRFLGAGAEEALKHLFPFGRGTRACLGLNLAWSELYLTLTCLVGSVDMQLFETSERDVTMVSEYFIGCLPEGSKGIRVRIQGEL